MNKKGFTLVELLVTIAVASLVLSLGAITVNNIIDNSKDKSVTIAHENIKKSANLYSKEFNNEIAWINNQSCISLEQLISKGYLRKEEVKDATHDYIIIEKDDNSTIISETTSDGVNNICNAIIKKTVTPPTSKDICNNLEYNGNTQYLIKENIGDVYKITNDSIKEGKNAGSYPVTIELQDGYHWKGNSTGSRDVYCTIKKGVPILTLDKNNQPAEQTKPTKVTLTSTVDGTLTIKSSNDKYATATSEPLNESSTTHTITINNNANRKTNTYITITLNPTNPNYETVSTTYIIGDITDIKRDKPTSATYCKNPYYNSTEQTITKPEEIGYTFYNNTQTNVGKYIVTAKLHPGFEWQDGSTADITFECEIKDLTYRVHYVGNSNTGQTYTDTSQCTDNKCGINRYSSGSKYNTSETTFEHTRDYIYGSSYNLVLNRFTKTGYSFTGWSKTKDGSVKYNDQHEVSNMINPKTDKNGTVVKLYAKWNPKTFAISLDKKGGTNGTTGPIYMKYDTGWYSNNTATAVISSITPPTKTGYTFNGYYYTNNSGSEFQVIDNNGKIVISNSTFTGDRTIYAKWTANVVKVKYNLNGGTWGGKTTNGNYNANSSGYLTLNGNVYEHKKNYEESYDLFNWDGTNIGAKKTGYHAVEGKEYLVGSATSTKTVSDSATIAVSSGSLCDASSGNCNVNLYINWTANTYTVKYDANGGTGTTNSSSHTYDTSKNLTANGFTKTGYDFAGWTDANGKSYSNSQSVTNLTSTNGGTVTLTAKWNPKTYTINYDANGGTGTTKSSTHTYDVASNLTANGFTKTGYHFIGWNTAKDGSGTTYNNQASVKNLAKPGESITLYAQWTINKVYVKYSVNGGTITSTTTSASGTKYTWTTDSSGVISKSTNGGSVTNILNTVNYGATMGTDGLVNYNNSKYINISRTGYYVSSNEWKCLSGNCKKTEYDHATAYTAAELCDASANDCTITLGVNWISDTTAPTCKVTYSPDYWTADGVDVTVTCSDSGSGCKTGTQYGYNLKASKKYTVTDNAGNSGSCTATIDTRTIYRTRTSSTKWKAQCIYYEIGAPENSGGVYSSKEGLASKSACQTYCNNIQLNSGGAYLEAKCTSYVAYSSWGTWTTTTCTPSNTCESLVQYR